MSSVLSLMAYDWRASSADQPDDSFDDEQRADCGSSAHREDVARAD